MNEKTSMFELLNERVEKEDIVKLVCNYDNKFNELEEENKELKSQLQQKENIIKEVKEYIEKHIKYECDDAFYGKQFYSYHLYDFDKKELLEILDKEVN